MSQEAINDALESLVARLVTATGYSVMWRGDNSTPSANPYLTYAIIPATPQRLDLGGQATAYRGAFQINVVYAPPINTLDADRMAHAIASALVQDDPFTDSNNTISVYFNAPAAVFSDIPGDGSYIIPVSVDYRADAFI